MDAFCFLLQFQGCYFDVLQIYHQIFFHDASAKDHGSLLSNMNLLRKSSLKNTLSYVSFRWMYYAHSYPCMYPMLKWFNSISLYYSRNLSLMMIFVNHEVGLDRWTVCMFPTKQSHHEMAALRQGRKGIGAVGNEFMKILNMNKKNTILNTNKSN